MGVAAPRDRVLHRQAGAIRLRHARRDRLCAARSDRRKKGA